MQLIGLLPGEEGQTVGVALQVLVEVGTRHHNKGEERAVAVLTQQDAQEGLVDLEVEVESHRTEGSGRQVGEEDSADLGVRVAVEFVYIFHFARPLLVDLVEAAAVLVLPSFVLAAEVLEDIPQTDVDFAMDGGEGLESAGFEVLAEEGVVLLLDLFLQFPISGEELLQVGPEFVLDAFEAEQDIQFGELGVVVDAVEAGLHVRHHCQHLFAVEGSHLCTEGGTGDVQVLAVQFFEEGEEVGEDVEGVQVLQVHVGVVDVGEVVEHLAPEPGSLVVQHHVHHPSAPRPQQTLQQPPPHSETDQQLLLQLPHLVDEVEGQEGAEGGQVVLEPARDEGEEEGPHRLPQEVGGDQLHLVGLALLGADLVEQVPVVGVEGQLQVLEHPAWLLEGTQLRIADEQVADGLHAASPVQLQQTLRGSLLTVEQSQDVAFQSHQAALSMQISHQNAAIALRWLLLSYLVLLQRQSLLGQRNPELLAASIRCLIRRSQSGQHLSIELLPQRRQVDVSWNGQLFELADTVQHPLEGRVGCLDIELVSLQEGLQSPHDELPMHDDCQCGCVALHLASQLLIPQQTLLPQDAAHSSLQLAAAFLLLERRLAAHRQLLQPSPHVLGVLPLHCVHEGLQVGSDGVGVGETHCYIIGMVGLIRMGQGSGCG